MDITPALAPFWFEPDGQENDEHVRFKIAPLTQPQIVDLFRTFDDHKRPTETTWFKAGALALDGGRDIEGLTVGGRPAQWPLDRDIIPYEFVIKIGVHIATMAWSLDGGAAEKN